MSNIPESSVEIDEELGGVPPEIGDTAISTEVRGSPDHRRVVSDLTGGGTINTANTPRKIARRDVQQIVSVMHNFVPFL